MTSHNTVQLTLLNEVNWRKRLKAWGANLLGKPGPSQNIVGRKKLEQTIDNVMGELQTYLGMRDMDIDELTPQAMSKFLASVGIGANAKDIPSNRNGLVDTKTVDAIVKDLSIKAITGEPMEYQKPKVAASSDPFGRGGARQTSASSDPFGRGSGAPPLSTAVKKRKSTLTAPTSNSEPTAPSNNAPQSASSTTEPTFVGAPTKPTTFNVDLPSWNIGTTPPSGSTPREPKTTSSAMPAGSTPSKPKATRSAKATPPKSTPAETPPVMPAGSTPVIKKSSKPRTKKQSESVDRLIDSVNRMSLDAYLEMSMSKYSKLTQILESSGLTLKDIGLWRVLKESTDQLVVLRKR